LVTKAEVRVDYTIIFTPADDGFQVEVFRKDTSCSSIWSCKKHRQGPWADPCH
jgi:hypothetical protein